MRREAFETLHPFRLRTERVEQSEVPGSLADAEDHPSAERNHVIALASAEAALGISGVVAAQEADGCFHHAPVDLLGDLAIGADAELIDEVVAVRSAEGNLGVADAESGRDVGGGAGKRVLWGDSQADDAVLAVEGAAVLGVAEARPAWAGGSRRSKHRRWGQKARADRYCRGGRDSRGLLPA
jgi:hypothetical protein